MQQLQQGTALQGGKYRIERVLGQGGFGNTYAGYNTFFDERVAIKEFFMQGLNDRDKESGSVSVSIERNKEQFLEQREKFKKEAQRIRKLNNPHIVRVHDLFEENGTTYYVMDFIDGESLAERLKRTGVPLPEQEVQKILPQLLDALKTVHDAGIWHLDLKPANIMIDKAGNVSLIDFGASKQLNAQKGGATTSTAISYTNGYAPREQMEKNYDKFGPWTDLYALGATLYTLLTNKRPPLPTDIDDDTSEDKHWALPMSMSISTEMHSMILWLMSTNRIRRPQNVEEVIARIKAREYNLIDNLNEDTIQTGIEDEETIIATSYKDQREGKEKKRIEDKESVDKHEVGSVIKNNKYKKWLYIGVPVIVVVLLIIFMAKSLNTLEIYKAPQKDERYIEERKELQNFDVKSQLGDYKYTGPVDSLLRPNGYGTASFTDGRKYKGEFIEGNLSGKNSYFEYPNGDIFEGTFKDNAFYEGTYTIAEDGSYFTGSFRNGQPDKGTWYDKNGRTIE